MKNNSATWQCPYGEAAPMDGAGITGLRLFCSSVNASTHKDRKGKIEFHGNMGNWGQTLACEDNNWVEGIDVRYVKRVEEEIMRK